MPHPTSDDITFLKAQVISLGHLLDLHSGSHPSDEFHRIQLEPRLAEAEKKLAAALEEFEKNPPPASVPTFTANIYVGLRERDSGKVHDSEEAAKLCQVYVDRNGLGLSLTKTEFIYTNGREPGVIVGLINYPRFPSSPEMIKAHALQLAELLKQTLCQYVVTIVFPKETVLLRTEPLDARKGDVSP